LTAMFRTIAAVAAAAMVTSRTPRPTHPQRRGCCVAAGVRLGGGADVVAAPGVAKACMALLLC
jgi:hypothetical protein